MEPRACVAQWEGDKLTLWASTQSPFRVHASLAAMFNLPDDNVRIIASYVGGGFGTKSAPHTDEGAGGAAGAQGAPAGEAAVHARGRDSRFEHAASRCGCT